MVTQRIALLFAGLLLALASPVSASAAAPADQTGGWQPLFNGTNLNGWYIFLRDQNEKNRDPNRLVQVRDGVLHFYPDAEGGSQQPFGYIATEKEFTNYQVRLEYKWGEKKFAPRANAKRDSGLLYHQTGPDRVWPTSVECQIQEGDTGDIWAVPGHTTRVTAPVDPATIIPTLTTNRTSGVVRTNHSPVFKPDGAPFVATTRVIRTPENEVDGWNTVEVIVRGDTAVHIVNGKVNNRCSGMEHLANDKWVSMRKGKISIQLEGAEVLYRNIQIRELPE